MLRVFGEAAIQSANAAPGERILDVGCGCGDTSAALAALVEPRGCVVGLDVSAPMLARATQRFAGRSNVAFIEGDASTAPVEASTFDVLFSRFGVMFFSDPVLAFSHLRGELRANGRVIFVCWRPLTENPWAAVPFDAVTRVFGRSDPEPEAEPEGAPGPFSFGDASRVRRILESAGFRAIKAQAFDATVVFGGSGNLDHAVDEIVRLGPVARLLVDRDAAAVEQARAAIKAVLPDYASAGDVQFQSGAWLVSAQNAG